MDGVCYGLLYWCLIRDIRAVMYRCVLSWKVCISVWNCGLEVMWIYSGLGGPEIWCIGMHGIHLRCIWIYRTDRSIVRRGVWE